MIPYRVLLMLLSFTILVLLFTLLSYTFCAPF
nr:MAG TPA: hypothetical protein [Caudoviricetes sp.]